MTCQPSEEHVHPRKYHFLLQGCCLQGGITAGVLVSCLTRPPGSTGRHRDESLHQGWVTPPQPWLPQDVYQSLRALSFPRDNNQFQSLSREKLEWAGGPKQSPSPVHSQAVCLSQSPQDRCHNRGAQPCPGRGAVIKSGRSPRPLPKRWDLSTCPQCPVLFLFCLLLQ